MKKTNLAVPLTVLFLLLFFACQQEDDSNFEGTQLVQQQNSITKSVTASEIPNVIQFLESKSNNRLEFLIDDSNSELGMNRSHEDNLSMTTALTNQIEMVTNNYGKSNYSFKLIEEQTKEGTYFLNLVVKEYKDEFYMYIIKYVPETTWLSNYTSELDFASFSGTLYFYNSEGIYVGRSDVSHGTSSTMDTREPCPKDGELPDDNNNNSTGGSSTSGGGTSSGSTGTTSTGTGSSTSGGGVNGGTSGTIAMVCACVGHGELEIMNGTCTCDTIEIIVIAGGSITNDRSMRDLVDCPPEDDCFDAVGDPCANGCDANGDCIEDSEEIENSGVVINADVEIARYNNFYNNLTSEQQTFLDANSTLEFQIQQLLNENGFEAEEVISDIINILMENPNLSFEEAQTEYWLANYGNTTFFSLPQQQTAIITDINDYFDCFTVDANSTYKVTVYVDQPISGSTEPYVDDNGNTNIFADKETVTVGHTFIQFSQSNNGLTVESKIAGLYPNGGVSPGNTSTASIYLNDEGHPYDVALTITVNSNDFFAMIDDFSQIENYDLNENNCTDQVLDCLNSGGVILPDTVGEWFLGVGGGSNPANLGEDIRQMDLENNMTRFTNSGVAPSNVDSGC